VLVDLARKTRPDILLLDLSMPRQDGMEVLRELSLSKIPVRTLLLTASIEKAQIVQALKLGAYGVILKEATTQRLFDSIQCVMAGQYWIGRESVSDLVRALRSVAPSENGARRQGLRAHHSGTRDRDPGCRRILEPRHRPEMLDQ